MSKKNTINVYFCLKGTIKTYEYAEKKLKRIAEENNITDITLKGISFDDSWVNFTMCLTLNNIANKKKESFEKINNAMLFMNKIFLELFDFSPCYTIEPTEQEKETAIEYMHMNTSVNTIKQGDELIYATQ